MRNKSAFAEPVPNVAVSVDSATVVENEKKDGDDSDGIQYAVSMDVVLDEEILDEEPLEETVKGAVEPAGGCEWYELIDEDKERFQTMVTRLASRAAAHLIVLAI